MWIPGVGGPSHTPVQFSWRLKGHRHILLQGDALLFRKGKTPFGERVTSWSWRLLGEGFEETSDPAGWRPVQPTCWTRVMQVCLQLRGGLSPTVGPPRELECEGDRVQVGG